MASSVPAQEADRHTVETVVRPAVPSRARMVREGYMPISEAAFDRPGAGSPFGDDQPLPLPLERLTYVHPTEDLPTSHE
jgi:succinate dehydrogenase / fumarate reductase iron-sulfur subunit